MGIAARSKENAPAKLRDEHVLLSRWITYFPVDIQIILTKVR